MYFSFGVTEYLVMSDVIASSSNEFCYVIFYRTVRSKGTLALLSLESDLNTLSNFQRWVLLVSVFILQYQFIISVYYIYISVVWLFFWYNFCFVMFHTGVCQENGSAKIYFSILGGGGFNSFVGLCFALMELLKTFDMIINIFILIWRSISSVQSYIHKSPLGVVNSRNGGKRFFMKLCTLRNGL